MTPIGANAIRIGDRIEFNQKTYVFAALLNGDVAELRTSGEPPLSILLSALLTDPSFKTIPVHGTRRRGLGESAIFAALPATVKIRAHWLQGHITEVLDGVPANANPEARPRREYDITARSMRQRLLAKEEELKTLGEGLSLSTRVSDEAAPELFGGASHQMLLAASQLCPKGPQGKLIALWADGARAGDGPAKASPPGLFTSARPPPPNVSGPSLRPQARHWPPEEVPKGKKVSASPETIYSRRRAAGSGKRRSDQPP